MSELLSYTGCGSELLSYTGCGSKLLSHTVGLSCCIPDTCGKIRLLIDRDTESEPEVMRAAEEEKRHCPRHDQNTCYPYLFNGAVLLEKLTGFRLVKKFTHFMEPETSLPHSQVPTTCPYLEPARSRPKPHIII